MNIIFEFSKYFYIFVALNYWGKYDHSRLVELNGLVMTIINPDDSVQNEQFNSEKDGAEDMENTNEKAGSSETGEKHDDETGKDNTGEVSKGEVTVKDGDNPVKGESTDPPPDDHPQNEETNDDKETDNPESSSDESVKSEGTSESEDEDEKSKDEPDNKGSEEEASQDDYEVSIDASQLEDLPEVDYSSRSTSELAETLEILIENRPPHEIKDDVDKIKSLFYKKYKAETESLKSEFINGGGNPEDFRPPENPLEKKVKSMLARYRGMKTEYSKQLEVEKQDNLKKKYDIIDKIKDLVNREESINKTFQEFRELQNEWYAIRIVPQSALKNLWETYNHNVEIFYDYIKINKELRDLDFKKNLEQKIRICEKAEELLLEPNAVTAFRTLQEYHQQWREIGPVPRESRVEIWERFKEITSKVNKRHHEYFESQKSEQKSNLDAKTALCEKVEEIISEEISTFKEWEDKAKEVIEIQKVWRTIGFAPKKHNNAIYDRFRESCDVFFQKKRDFYARNKDIQSGNLQLKIELCEKAEQLMESTDWKETTDALIRIQKQWKEIGAVPRKYSEKIWKRFRSACDHFFERKAEHFSGLDDSFSENLKKKLQLIEMLENFEVGDDMKSAFEKLKEIQGKWAEIGFVPFKDKDEVARKYRDALNKQFDKLQIDEEQKEIIKYRNKLENISENPRSIRKLRSERERFINRIKQLESDIVLWENNIGFFSKSKNAESLIQEVNDKIENARNTIQVLEEKVRMIDQSGLDD